MNWKYKAVLHRAFSALPFGGRLHYFFQRHVTRSLPTSEGNYPPILAQAQQHIAACGRHLRRPLPDAAFYEFGAGFDMLVPLAHYGLGVNNQTVIDIRRLIKPELVN